MTIYFVNPYGPLWGSELDVKTYYDIIVSLYTMILHLLPTMTCHVYLQ